MIPRTHPLAGVREAFNAVFVEADAAGQLMFYGPGAGGDPTACAVLGDLVAVARHRVVGGRGPGESAYADLPVLPMGAGRPPATTSASTCRTAGRARPGRDGLRRARRLDRDGPPAVLTTGRVRRRRRASLVVVTHTATDAALAATVDALAALPTVARRHVRHARRRRVTMAHQWRGVIEEYRDRLPSLRGRPGGHARRGRHAAGPRGVPLRGRRRRGLVKVEGLNPTGSFKDRGMTTAISVAARAGAEAVVCASTGNTSASAAAYATKAGMTCGVLVPEGKIAMGKLSQAIVHGATLLQVDGNFDDCLTLARKLAESYPVELVNSVNPARIEGQKTAAFEVVDALGDAPDIHCLPVGNAGNITAYWRGYREYCQDAAMPGPATHRPAHVGLPGRGGRARSCWATRSTTPRPSPRRSGSATRRPGRRPSRPATTPAA